MVGRNTEDGRYDRIVIGDLSPGDIALLKNIADEAAERTVHRFSTAMGLDPHDPMTAQRDMQWVRKTRERYEGIHGKAIMTVLGIAVLSAIQALWVGVKTMVGGPMPGGH